MQNVKEWLRQTAVGMAHVHQRGFIHRDLKPRNILFSGDPDDEKSHIVIGDFGLATVPNSKKAEFHDAFGKEDDFATNDLGTYEYMAPEQRAREEIDEKVDVYAFGIICYEVMSSYVEHSERKEFLEKVRTTKDDYFEDDEEAVGNL
ncbi:unnamed protein product [Caenorhabditis auriculariae]|uniref:Protein kinase domain-containing protein n=1 Tax=Caenorhabditis auriculariae TaxID=2777116 RepID=A0A8S1HD02_9PELO|nr:unnamed protein product [Caenorhabditis auriculariae]